MSDSESKGCLFALLKLLGVVSDAEKSTNDEVQKSTAAEVLPYRRKDYLLTKAERAFFDVLYPIVENQLHLFAMVRLADLIEVVRGTEKRQSFFNRIQSKHIDFVLCDKKELRPILAIELDDSSHQRRDRQQRDAFVDNALKQAGLPLLRVPVRREYDPQQLKQQIKYALNSVDG